MLEAIEAELRRRGEEAEAAARTAQTARSAFDKDLSAAARELDELDASSTHPPPTAEPAVALTEPNTLGSRMSIEIVVHDSDDETDNSLVLE